MIWQCGEINAPKRQRGGAAQACQIEICIWQVSATESYLVGKVANRHQGTDTLASVSSIMPDHPCPLASSPALALLCWAHHPPLRPPKRTHTAGDCAVFCTTLSMSMYRLLYVWALSHG